MPLPLPMRMRMPMSMPMSMPKPNAATMYHHTHSVHTLCRLFKSEPSLVRTAASSSFLSTALAIREVRVADSILALHAVASRRECPVVSLAAGFGEGLAFHLYILVISISCIHSLIHSSIARGRHRSWEAEENSRQSNHQKSSQRSRGTSSLCRGRRSRGWLGRWGW